MTSTDGAAVLSVRGPADLISAVPFLLGFHPQQSLVVVGLAGSRVVVTMRIDLDEVADAGAVDHLVAAMSRGGAESILALIYDETADLVALGLPWRGLIAQLGQAAEFVHASLEDAFLVSAGRFWSYSCDDPRCCPPEGTALPPEDGEIAAAATFAGMVALPDRGSVEELLRPAPPEERRALLPALDAAVDTAITALATGSQASLDRGAVRALFARARAAGANAGSLPEDDDELAYLGASLRRMAVRDAVWMGIDDRRLDGDALWRLLARRLPSPYDAAPLFLLAWASWRRGNGAVARMAVDRALDSDPSYSAAELLQTALAGAVDPRTMPRLRRRERRCDR